MRKFMILLLVCCLTFSLPCMAATSGHTSDDAGTVSLSDTLTWDNPETGYHVVLEDDADVLSGDEEEQLMPEMQEITAYGNAVFKSVSDNNSTAEYFAQEYYYELFGYENGTLFLIDMDNRELCLINNGDISETITNAYADTITDNVYSYASRGDYYRCAATAFEQVHTLLSGHKIMQPMKYISNALLALILAALIHYFIVMLCSASSKPSRREILNSISTGFSFTNPKKDMLSQTKTYSPVRSSSGGSHSSSGSHRSSHRSSHSSSSHRSSSHRSSSGSHRF
ncbi:MAG: TPM domain-containing protein [Suilimivivens sp.]